MRLISLYHSLLIEAGVEDYELEQCHEDFRFGLLRSVNLDTMAIAGMDDALIVRDKANGIDLLDWVGPVAAAAEAHDVLGLLR